MRKVYLAGPDVFFDNALEISQSQKSCCAQHSLIGLAPLDNEIPPCSSKSETAEIIVRSNIEMINACDFVIANLANFRGTADHPSCDSGTAWECGYAVALHKPVLAYTDKTISVPRDLRSSIDYCIIGSFADALRYSSAFKIISGKKSIPECSELVSLDPADPSIHDADAYGAFRLGYAFAQGINAVYHVSDARSLVEKYGPVDRNGVKFENFDAPVNIMISVNHKLV